MPSRVRSRFSGFRIAVDDPPCVRCGEHVEELAHEGHHLANAELSAAPLPPRVEGFAVEQLHHDEDAAILGDVIVEHADRSGVANRVRGIALAKKTGALTCVNRELSMQDFHGDPICVPDMRRRVNDSHATGSE